MLLLNVSGVCHVERRRMRNEAFFHHLVEDHPAIDEGVFVDNPNLEFAAPAPPVREGFAGAKPIHVVRPVLDGRTRAVDAAAELARTLEDRWLRGRDYALLMNCPFAFSTHLSRALAPAARHRFLDLSDDWTAWTPYLGVPENARALVALADKVVYVNEATRERLPHARGRVAPNGCDVDNFRREPPRFERAPFWPKPPGARYVGFIGGLFRTRMDLALLDEVLPALSDVTFLFVGYTADRRIPARITAHPNAHFIEEVAPDVLPAVVRSFDVGIVPHQVNDVTRGNDLLKVLDYFAAGIPVVSTACSDVERYGDAVSVASSPEDFVRRVRAALAAPHDPRPGHAIAEARAWRPLVKEIGEWLLSDGG